MMKEEEVVAVDARVLFEVALLVMGCIEISEGVSEAGWFDECCWRWRVSPSDEREVWDSSKCLARFGCGSGECGDLRPGEMAGALEGNDVVVLLEVGIRSGERVLVGTGSDNNDGCC
jgi:hypothetical protein